MLESKVRAIGAARSSVGMEMFIFRDSDVGLRFRSALAAAARRGVRVRLIVDAVGSFGLGRDYFDELVAAGGAMRWFNELRLASFSFRDHRKLLEDTLGDVLDVLAVVLGDQHGHHARAVGGEDLVLEAAHLAL